MIYKMNKKNFKKKNKKLKGMAPKKTKNSVNLYYPGIL